jgi:hypothetical protein
VRERYLGDSYDLVKRFWAEALTTLGPLYAHPRFVPAAIRPRYAAVTRIPVLDPGEPPAAPFGLLFDPHTGIPLPADGRVQATAAHAPLPFIVRVNARLRPAHMICFDQSHHRRHELPKAGQLERKRDLLRAEGIDSFYYVSHAPFLFTAGRSDALAAVQRRLVSVGVPPERFAPHLV